MHFLKSHKRCFFFFVILLLLTVPLAIRTISPTQNESYHARLLEEMEHASSFSEFTNALFCYEATTDSITTAYTLKNPSSCQIPELSPILSSFTFKKYEKSKQNQSDEKTLTLLSDTLNHFNPSDLKESEQITYCLLQKHFDLSKKLCKYAYYEDLLGSTTGVQANLPVTLGEYPLHTEEDIKTYLKLLPQIPDYFENVISYEKHRTALGFQTPDFLHRQTKDGLETLLKGFKNGDNCFIDTFNERINQITELSSEQKTDYQTRNQKVVKKYVIPAYQKLYDYVEECLPAGTGKDNTLSSVTTEASPDSSQETTNAQQTSYSVNQEYIPKADTPYGLSTLPDGTAYYDLLVKSNTGSGHSVPELIQMTEQTLKQTLGDVLNVALTDQDAYLYYCEHPLETYYETPEAILEALSLMIREDYPVLTKNPSYQIKSVPDSLAVSLSPAFYMIPAVDDYENNTIYINSRYTNKENGNLFTTLAHEGFPGHMYQTVYFNDTNPSLIRQIIDYPGYAEGWATYVEINAFAFPNYPLEGDSLCRLYQADTIINLALCSRIDMGVNYENWTLKDVNQFFEDNGFNSYYAADVYSYVVEAPSVYLRYFIGYLEIMELKEAYQHDKMETYTEKEFHKEFLDIGPADFETIKKYMLKNP